MKKSVAAEPSDALRSAMSLISSGHLLQARGVLVEVLRDNPKSKVALQMLGMIASREEKHDEAIECLQQAMSLDPTSADTCLNLGIALGQAGRFGDASSVLDLAIKRAPYLAEARLAHGTVLIQMGREDKALERFKEAIGLKPSSGRAYDYLVAAYSHLGRLAELRTALERIVTLPDSTIGPLAAALRQLDLCDWKRYKSNRTALVKRPPTARFWTGFYSLLVTDDPPFQRQCAEATDPAVHRHWSLPGSKVASADGRRIKVAYVSADFRAHPTSRLIPRLLEMHDRSRFEITGVSLRKDDGSPERQRIAAAADAWVDAHDWSGAAIANAMRERQIDIAVDLMGHTLYARPSIYSLRAAPIQVNYLGFPGTTGLPWFDYMVADPYIATPELREASAEKLVILPDCYQCNDDARKIAQRVPDRAEHGLPRDGFVFASFNVTRKINPEVFDVWMRILRQVDGSVLWLLTNSEEAKENLRTEASRRAVAPERLVFAQRVTPDEHLARLRLADLHIDTFPYSAHTTASDALWAGCPILTRTGRGFPSRVCASLLSTIGVPELITTSWQEYEGLALTLARDRQMLDGLRSRIVEGSKTSPLFDTSRYCRNLEAAYQEMVRIAASGGQVAEIDVRALRG